MRAGTGGLLITLVCALPLSLMGIAASDAGTTTVPRPDHIVVVVEENHSDTNIIGNADAPYINSLASENAYFSQSYALTHPSQPNYIAMFSGSTQGVTNDSCPHSFSAPSLGDQLLGAGLGFVGYSESLPSVGYLGCTSGKYAAKHSPWVNFPSLPASTNQPLTAFPTDFAALPEVSFVIPNLDNDMHDGTVAQGDSWLQSHLGAYVTWAKTHNSLLVLTFDEDDRNNGNRITTVVAGERVVPGVYDDRMDHYSLLRTIQDAYGLPPLGNSATVEPLLDLWTSPAGNQPPVPDFTATCQAETCTFDARTSSDPDGSVTGHRWSFGDGTTGTGAQVTHVYGGRGPIPVRLRVADNGGTTSFLTRQVSPPGSPPFASDTFARTTTSAWGNADVGGPWTLSGTSTGFAVAPGAATMQLAAGSTLTAMLNGVSGPDTDLLTTFAADRAGTGNGIYLRMVGRRVSSGNDYRALVRLTASNTVVLNLARLVGGVETAVTPAATIPGLTVAPGKRFSARVQVLGTAPTTVRARVWQTGTTEPNGWAQSAQDSTSALQGAGSLGLSGYLSGSSTTTPVLSFSSLAAEHTGGTPQNNPPTARFTSSCSNLRCTFDASTSSDSEGPVASYAWTFGDTTSGAGATPTHDFTQGGTFPVTLSVTDGGGGTDSVSHDVTVTAPPTQVLARDAFSRTVSGGWGAADTGGPWTPTGSASTLSVTGGQGLMTLPAGKQVITTLGGVSSAGTDLTFAFGADRLTAGHYLMVTGRRVGGNEYRARVRIVANGLVTSSLTKVVVGTESNLSASATVPGPSYVPGSMLRLRLQVSGTSPTTVRSKVWPATGIEPATWQHSATDTTAGLQQAGSLALTTYLSGSATNGPLAARFDDLAADKLP